jgi:hypothetical protein
MLPPSLLPRKTLAALAGMLVLAGCQTGPTAHPVPSVQQLGGDLKCSTGDHAFEDIQAGWEYCYPAVWKFDVRSQGYASPPQLDLNFDVTDVQRPCPSGVASAAYCSPTGGYFGVMLISTYDRAGAANLSTWAQANLPNARAIQPIAWGNSVEAGRFADGRRIALTPHHVVVMELRAGSLLDLEGGMSARLNTWKFKY